MKLLEDNQKPDVLVLIDGYDWNREKANRKSCIDVAIEAQGLTGLVRSHGRQLALYCIVHEEDHERQTQYGQLGHHLCPMNGNRPTEIVKTVQELVHLIQRDQPRKLIVIGHDGVLGPLCEAARRINAEICVWSTGTSVSQALRPYSNWQLSDLLPTVQFSRTVAGLWLDIENHLITMSKNGMSISMTAYRQALLAIGDRLGVTIQTWQAWADWSSLRDRKDEDPQRDLERIGIKTYYQIGVPGKSTNDMAIVGSIHESLERNAEIDTYLIGTGDGDFIPPVNAIQAHGKRAVVIALRGSLSQSLAACVDEVIYLDDYLPFTQTAKPLEDEMDGACPSSDTLAALFSVAHLLRKNRWSYVYRSKLPRWISASWVDKAINEKLLCAAEGSVITINAANRTAIQGCAFEAWLSNLLYYCYHKPNPFAYVDTALLFTKARANQDFAGHSFSQERRSFLNYLDAATTAHLITKEKMPHPNTPERTIYVWRLI